LVDTPQNELPGIASLWIGARLSFLEQLCLKSFADRGHQVTLYTYDHVENVPANVQLADASAIMPTDKFIVNRALGSPGPHADRFRYHLMAQTDETWVDTDAYCLRPFPKRDYLFARHFKDHMANGVLRLPKNSPTLADLLRFTEDEHPNLPPDFYWRDALNRQVAQSVARGDRPHISDLRWETWGPDALTYFLRKNGEDRHQVAPEVLYPFGGSSVGLTVRKPTDPPMKFPETTESIHFYGSGLRKILQRRAPKPLHPRSLLARLCAEHDIDHNAAPVEPTPSC